MRGGAARVSLLSIFLLLLAPAAVQAAGKRIGVAKFEGAQEALVRKKVMASLKSHGFELVRSREIQDALGSTGASLDSDDGLVKLARELSLSAIVTGEVGPKRAKIVVHDGGEGSILGDASFSGANPRKLANEVGLTFWKKLGPDVGRGHVPEGAKKAKKSTDVSPEDDENATEGGEAAAGDTGGAAAASQPKADTTASADTGSADQAPPPPKKPKLKMEETPAEEPAAASTPSGLPWLDIEVGGGGFHRTLMFSQNVQINGLGTLFLPYTLPLGGLVAGHGVIYPFEPLVGGALGNLGVEGEILQGILVSTTAHNMAGNMTFSSVVHDFSGGLRYRFPFAARNDVYLSVTAGEDAFTFSGGTQQQRATFYVPDTIYRYVRPGLGLHLALTDVVTLRLAGGYRYVFNGAGPYLSGPNGYFPHLTVAGADAEVEGGYRLGEMFEIRVGVEYRRYWFDMHSQVSDMNRATPAFAGGLVDQSFAFTGGIAILLGTSGAAKSGGGGEEPPPPPPPSKSHARHKSDDDSGDSEGEAPAVDSDSGAKSGGGSTDE